MNKVIEKLFITYSLFLIPFTGFSQDTLYLFEFSPTLNKTRVDAVKYSSFVAYPLSMYWLYTQWYESYPQSDFHFFNDETEWEGMDKAGHIMTTYSISGGYAGLLRWSGVERRKAAWIGTGVGFLFQTTIEVFDGFSSQWGFSFSDIAANTAGSAVFMGQELLWNEQRVKLKISMHETSYPQYRPGLLGDGFSETWLKDYNGQTYWLSVNPSAFMRKETWFPIWLSIAGGYGAEGMTGGKSNPETVNGEPIPQFDRYKQYYISLDIALDRIKTKSHFLHTFSQIISFIKIPMPTVEFNGGHGTKFYWLYF